MLSLHAVGMAISMGLLLILNLRMLGLSSWLCLNSLSGLLRTDAGIEVKTDGLVNTQ